MKGRLFNRIRASGGLMRGLGLAVALCVLSAQAPYVPPQDTIDVAVRMSVQGGGKPVVMGTANLPDGFMGVINIFDGPKPVAGGEYVILRGKFQSGPFSINGEPFPRGTYRIEISSVLNELQPDSVRAIIGPYGIRLRGNCVARDLLTNSRILGCEMPFEIR